MEKKNKDFLRKKKGITLIALVVTIVVLLILAAVSISMLGGENGIITQAQQSKDKTEQAKVEEMVSVAIGSLIAENKGDTSSITPAKVAEQVNKENNRDDVTAEGSTFPTNILFEDEGRKVGVSIDLAVTGEIEEEIYSADVSEEDIAPADIFEYEIIEGTGETSSTDWDSLPTKEARITGMNPKYCNATQGGYVSDTGERYENTHYEIVLEDGTKISDTLVIPYQVEIEGEMYRITEANINAIGKEGYALPKVKTIIYPNTIKKIEREFINFDYYNFTLSNVILSKKLQEIGENAFDGCSSLTSIEIPSSVTSIGNDAFRGCSSLTIIEIPNSVTSIGSSAFNETQWYNSLSDGEVYIGKVFYEYKGQMPENTSIQIKDGTISIGDSAFFNCSSLTSIEIPSSVTSIGDSAFSNCSSLTSIEIPNSVTSIGNSAFKGCSALTSIEIPNSVTSIGDSAFYNCSSLTSIEIPSSVTNIGWGAFYECTSLTTVNYTGTMAQWQEISINDYGNDALINAQIICTDGTLNQ